jgi:AraC-like DNA-binding protein
MELSFHVEGDRAVLVHKPLYRELAHREDSEYAVGAVGAFARRLTGTELVPLEVRFTHDPPRDARRHEALCGAPVLFRQSYSGCVFPAALLSVPVVGHDSERNAALALQAEQMLQRMPQRANFSRRVQELIGAELRGGNPSVDNIAAKLGMHPKTLSRRLKTEGTSHQELLDQLRYRRAEHYLRQMDLRISEVAWALGYADASSFNKAFKRWTGTVPHAFRQRLEART